MFFQRCVPLGLRQCLFFFKRLTLTTPGRAPCAVLKTSLTALSIAAAVAVDPEWYWTFSIADCNAE